jgi:hypothetical protein
LIIIATMTEKIPREAMPLVGALVGVLTGAFVVDGLSEGAEPVGDADGLLDSATVIELVEGALVLVVMLVALGIGDTDKTVKFADGIWVLGAADAASKGLPAVDGETVDGETVDGETVDGEVVPTIKLVLEGIGDVVMDAGAGNIVVIDVSTAEGMGEVVGTTSS